MSPFVPTPAPKHPQPVRELLLEISIETIFDCRLQQMSSDVRHRRQTRSKIIDRIAIAAHIRVIDIRKQPQNAFFLQKYGPVNLELDVL
jgi:hypothetical protein